MDPPIRNKESLSRTCHGTPEKKKQDETATKIAKNHAEFSNYSLETTKSSNNGSKLPELPLWNSHQVNGTISSVGKPSTLMQCSHHCTTFPLLRRTLDAWDILKSPLADQNLQKGSKRVANGPVLGTPPSKRLNLLSLTESKSLENTESTLKGISLQRSHPRIDRSSYMIVQSATKSGEARTLYSQTPIASPGSIQLSSCPMELNPTMQGSHSSSHLGRATQKPKSVIATTPSVVAEIHPKTVISNTCANDASKWVMGKNLTMSKKLLVHELCPKYLRYNIWDSGEHFSCSSADWTETALPLPTIPKSELANPIVTRTINENPHLFDIVTPIFVERFEDLLESHPNQPFVKSVCCGLQEGF